MKMSKDEDFFVLMLEKIEIVLKRLNLYCDLISRTLKLLSDVIRKIISIVLGCLGLLYFLERLLKIKFN